MIEAAGITLREAVEAILVITIMVTYVKRAGEPHKKKFIYQGAIIAVLLSIALAIGLSSVGINPENELVEGILFMGAALLVGTLVIWMWRHAKHMKKEIEQKMKGAASGLALGFVAFIMVMREGVETVIFLQSLLLAGSSPLENFMGGLFGIVLAIIFGALFLKGTHRINLSVFFKVTSAILAILVIKLIANGLHEFFEVGVLPSTPEILGVVGTLAKSSTGAAIIALMLAFLILLVIYDVLNISKPNLSELKPAERRKAQYEFAKEKYSKLGLSFVLVIMIFVIMTPTIMAKDLKSPTPIPVTPTDNMLKIEVPETDGFYKYSYNDARIMMAVKHGKPHIALDGCYICPPKGYAFNGEVLICINCDAPIEIETVGSEGGCNPYVIDYTYQDGIVNIPAEQVSNIWGSLE